MNLPKFVQTKFTKEQKRISKTKMISNYKKRKNLKTDIKTRVF